MVSVFYVAAVAMCLFGTSFGVELRTGKKENSFGVAWDKEQFGGTLGEQLANADAAERFYLSEKVLSANEVEITDDISCSLTNKNVLLLTPYSIFYLHAQANYGKAVIEDLYQHVFECTHSGKEFLLVRHEINFENDPSNDFFHQTYHQLPGVPLLQRLFIKNAGSAKFVNLEGVKTR